MTGGGPALPCDDMKLWEQLVNCCTSIIILKCKIIHILITHFAGFFFQMSLLS